MKIARRTLFVTGLLMAGCASTNPVALTTDTRFQFTWADVGAYYPRVKAEACKGMVLGFRWGSSGYGAAYEAALAQVEDADALMDVAVDTRGVHVLAFDVPGSDAAFGIYARRCTVVSGIPIAFAESGTTPAK